MKGLNHKSGIAIIVLITLLAIAGCQSVAKVQPTATPIVVVEGEEQCSVMDLRSVADGIPVNDPELGEVVRAQIMAYTLGCGNPYISYKCIDVQDTHHEGEVLHFTSSVECVTNEGGVWKGTCEAAVGEKAVCTSNGDGKYKGLQLYTDADTNTYIMKYRVTKLVGE